MSTKLIDPIVLQLLALMEGPNPLVGREHIAVLIKDPERVLALDTAPKARKRLCGVLSPHYLPGSITMVGTKPLYVECDQGLSYVVFGKKRQQSDDVGALTAHDGEPLYYERVSDWPFIVHGARRWKAPRYCFGARNLSLRFDEPLFAVRIDLGLELTIVWGSNKVPTPYDDIRGLSVSAGSVGVIVHHRSPLLSYAGHGSDGWHLHHRGEVTRLPYDEVRLFTYNEDSFFFAGGQQWQWSVVDENVNEVAVLAVEDPTFLAKVNDNFLCVGRKPGGTTPVITYGGSTLVDDPWWDELFAPRVDGTTLSFIGRHQFRLYHVKQPFDTKAA